MKQVFLDTNVIIDFLADRKPFSVAAAQIFNLAVSGKVKIYISALSYSNIYYILRQAFSNTGTIKLLDELCEMTEIADVTKAIIKKSRIRQNKRKVFLNIDKDEETDSSFSLLHH